MKTKRQTSNQVNVVTLGCSKNLVDSELIMTQLEHGGFQVAHESNPNADIVIINTCGFIESAKQESINTILDYIELKKQGDIQQLFVTGCLSERYKDDMQTELPEVDRFFGTFELNALLHSLNTDYKHELHGERKVTTPSHYAYLKIAEGCNRPCSFCAIPLMRGVHRSKSIEDLVEEATKLTSKGVKEIMLIAQDLTYYGLDLYHKRALNELLVALSEVDNLKWLRLHYAYPSGFPIEILETIAKTSNICNYIDMPLQHISDPVLKRMRRGITKQRTYQLLEKVRQEVPEVAIRTTFMVGFPGETDQDYQELIDFIEEVKFERVGVFEYSHEENTHAYGMEDSVPSELKSERAGLLMEKQYYISEKLNQAKIGQKHTVIIDRKENQLYYGRSEFDSPEVDNEIIIQTNEDLQIGQFYQVSITGAEAYDLHGVLS